MPDKPSSGVAGATPPLTMRSAVADALAGLATTIPEADEVDGAETQDEGTAEEAEATDGDGETPDAPGAEGNEQPDEGAEDASSEPGTAAAEAGEADDDVPNEYFGQDLSGLPAEERRSIITQFQERDRHIQKLLREKAEGEKADDKPASAEAAETDEVSDADILSALSLDPADDSAEAKAILALARMNLTLQSEVKDMASKDAVRETEHVWETTLTALEKEYGGLPVDRTEVYRVAAQNGIAEPIDAYWRIMGPGRQEVMAEVKKRREAATAALAKDQKPAKPKSSAKVVPAALVSKDSKDATVEAFNQLRKEMGWALSDEDND